VVSRKFRNIAGHIRGIVVEVGVVDHVGVICRGVGGIVRLLHAIGWIIISGRIFRSGRCRGCGLSGSIGGAIAVGGRWDVTGSGGVAVSVGLGVSVPWGCGCVRICVGLGRASRGSVGTGGRPVAVG